MCSSDLAIAMNPLNKLAPLLNIPDLATIERSATFVQRDAIRRIIAQRVQQQTTRAWLDVLEPADIWCAEVLDWPRLLNHEAFKALGMTQRITRSTGSEFDALRCPVRIDRNRLYESKGSPAIGEQTAEICREFGL